MNVYGQDGGTQICRRAKQGRFGVELFKSGGNREAYTKLISHPKAKSKEELFTALKIVPKEEKLTKLKQIEEQARKNRERQHAEELALREKRSND